MAHRVAGIFTLLLLTSAGPPEPQSGRGLMHGYVAFEGVSYNEVTQGAIKARIELRGNTEFNRTEHSAEIDSHGGFDIPAIPMGEYILRITAPGHRPYQIEVYIPSDFQWRLAVMLKKGRGG